MFKSFLTLSALALLTGVAVAEPVYTEQQLRVASPRISEQSAAEFRIPSDVDATTTASIRFNATSNADASASDVGKSPRLTDQLGGGAR